MVGRTRRGRTRRSGAGDEDGDGGGSMPGFGLGGAVAGLAGVGGLLARRLRDGGGDA